MKTHIRNLILLLAMLIAMPEYMCAAAEGSVDTIKKYLNALEENPNDRAVLKTVAFYYMNIGDSEKTKFYARRLLDLARSTGDRDFSELYGRIALGSALLDEDHDGCFRQFESARAIAEDTGNHDAMLSVNNGFGMYYLLVQNDVYTATTYYYRALEDAKAIDDNRRYGIILSNLAGAYLAMEDASGQKLAEQSHEIALKRGEPIPLYYAKYTLAHFYLLTDSLDAAARLVDETEKLYRDGGFGDEPNLYLIRGELAEKRGDIREAYRNYAMAMENFSDSDPSQVTATYISYARLLRKDHRTASAIKVLEYGLNNTASEMRIHTPELLRELVYSYRDAGDMNKALDYSLSYQQYQDSVFRLSRERALHENRIRHEVYANERMIDEQRLELVRDRYKIAVLVICVIAVLGLLLLTYSNYRKKDRLYRAIVTQNSECIKREQLLLEQIERTRKSRETASAPPLPTDKAADLMAGFTSLMMERKLFCDPSITVGTVAELLGSNRTYLSKAINESTGKTFTQLVNEYRIREAVALISDLEANLPLKQICFDVGFQSLSTFYSSFQAATGMTPARYRAQIGNM